MENKKLGILFIVISLIFFIFLIYFGKIFYQGIIKEGILSFVHIGFGFFGFMLALGFYLLLFNKTDEKIMRRLEEEKNKKISDERFNIILKALDPHEKKVMKAVKEQDGITQSTLRLRTDMSKAKLSYVLQELEKRNLIKRIPEGKTLKVFLKI